MAVSAPKYRWVHYLVFIAVMLWIPDLLRRYLLTDNVYLIVPFAWLLFIWYFWRAPKIGLAASELRRKVAVAAVVGGFLVTTVGAFLVTFKIAWFGLLLSVSGLTLLRLGVVPWTRVAANLSLIWIAWPWPAAIHQRIDGGVHRLGIQTATAVFDLVGIPVFSVGNVLEFRSQTLDTTVWMNGPDSFVGFLLFAALTLVWLRRGLVQSLLTVLSIPLIAWVGELAKILLWYWAYHDFAVDLSVGWSLVFFRVGILACQLLLLMMVNSGVHWALLPVLVDPNARTNVSAHSLFNMVTLWPLQISVTAEQADQDYLGDNDEDDGQRKFKESLVTRRMPDVELAKKAIDPWTNTKLLRSTLAIGGIAVLFSLVANLLPAAKPLSLPQFDDQAVDSLANNRLLEGLEIPATFTDVDIQRGDNQTVITWNLAGKSGAVEFLARFPSRNTLGVWYAPQGMATSGPAQPWVVEDMTMYEVAFSGEIGASSIGWFAAMLPTGESVKEQGWMYNLKGRLSNSILGRLVGSTNEQLMYETALLVDSQLAFSERQKREFRTLFARLSQRLAASVRGIQP